jgi:DNA transposition AAA+ family ATPase
MREKTTVKGIHIQDRTEDEIRGALVDQAPEVVETAVRLWQYAVKNHLGVSRLGQACGIGSGMLSPWFNGEYTGDSVAIAERIDKFFWRMEQKDKYGAIRRFVETRLATTLWNVFEKTRIVRRIQMVEGPEQVGKSRAAAEYTARNNSGRTVYMSLSGGAKSSGEFVWRLADALGIPYAVKLSEKRLRIRAQLEACDLIIIDEAHLAFTWTDRALAEWLDYLRTDIFDNGSRGIVLIATNSNMMDGLMNFKRRSRYNLGQTLGRMRNDPVRIDPAEDIVEEDVKALVERYYKPGKAALERLSKVAAIDQLGHFGLLEDILNEAWTAAKSRNKSLDDATVLTTVSNVMSSLKTRRPMYERI